MTTADEFMQAAPPRLDGSSPWASRYATEIRRIVRETAARAPRSRQVHLGPSELGVECDRQVVGKLAGLAATNHVVDPWASVLGTAFHAWMADALDADNLRTGVLRWVTEQRVVPHPEHSGTADAYDAIEEAVVDHKCLGPTSMAKVRAPEGPPRQYVVQTLLYAKGYRNLGLPVKRVVLVAYPRTAASLDGLYVWEHALTATDNDLIDQVFTETDFRKQLAEAVVDGRLSFRDVPSAPTSDGCYFCPFWRPEAAKDSGPGCPGTYQSRSESEK